METEKCVQIVVPTCSFKSYYVVWKPVNGTFEAENGSEFKSYYVVWKLPRVANIVITGQSLNRTMQYGNHTSTLFSLHMYCCLNRTMQYGNGNIDTYFLHVCTV